MNFNHITDYNKAAIYEEITAESPERVCFSSLPKVIECLLKEIVSKRRPHK